jgi:hypothetical protein
MQLKVVLSFLSNRKSTIWSLLGRSKKRTFRQYLQDFSMPFALKDTKLLWGRAAGICSNPVCREKVTECGDNGGSFLTGEMAHIIAQSTGGPRGNTMAGSDSYENLILLCPTCHRKIDKSPKGTYTVDMLRDWKVRHEAWVDSLSEARTYTSARIMAVEVLNRRIRPNI